MKHVKIKTCTRRKAIIMLKLFGERLTVLIKNEQWGRGGGERT